MTDHKNLLDIAAMQSVIETHSVESLIPHSPPMVLLDRIVSVNEQGVVAEIDIQAHCKFYDEANHGVPSWVGIRVYGTSYRGFCRCQSEKC